MKLSEATKKLTCMKSKVIRVLAAATLAGAVLTAAAPAAKAQHVVFGIQYGGQPYAQQGYYGQQYDNGYYSGYGDQRRDEWRRRQEYRRQQEYWRQQQEYQRQRQHEEHERWEHRRDDDDDGGRRYR